MAEEISPFLTESFQSAVQKCCAHANWPIARVEDNVVALKIDPLQSGNPQVIYISESTEMVKFSLDTIFRFAEGEDVPHALLMELMQDNDSEEIGYWCLEYFKGKRWISLRHLEPKEGLSEAVFQQQLLGLVIRCDLFESEHADEE